MPQILYTGKLPWWLKFGVNMNQVLAWIFGNTKDTSASKERIKQGYDEVPTWNDVPHYDDRALGHYMKIANELVTGIFTLVLWMFLLAMDGGVVESSVVV